MRSKDAADSRSMTWPKASKRPQTAELPHFGVRARRPAKVILQREGEGLNWHTGDPAKLYLSNTGDFSEAPTELSAFIIGRGGVVRPATRVVKLEGLRLMGHGLFGESRPCGYGSSTRWTGDAYKFGIYEEPVKRSVIIRTDGSGTTAYAIDVAALW